MLRLGEIRNATGAQRETKRLGRGRSSGQGKTAGKGHKGQFARTGGKVRRGFEGGQMPLYRRIPKRGFTNIFGTDYAIINVGDLETFSQAEVTLQSLKETGALKTRLDKLKILGNGDLKKALTIKAHAVSASAKDKIEKAGGTIEILK
jgi:large subunit ribosomal protein L15